MGLFDSKQTTKNEIPSWLESGSQDAVNLGKKISSQAYQPYRGDRVAGLSQNEQQASQIAQYGTEESRGYLNQAAKKVSQIGSFDEADLSGYMNPYTDAVLQPQLREANRAYESNRASLLNSKAGAWGGDRAAFAESELAKRHGELVTDLTGRAHADAFDRAVQTWGSDQDRKLRSADALRAVGGDVAQLNKSQIQDLMLTGGTERILKQADLDFDYQQFVENRDWDVRNLQPLLASLQVPHSTTTTQQSKGSTLGGLIGMGATLAGAYFSGGGSLAGMFGGGAAVAAGSGG